jgi:hypothetical protein
VPPYPTRKKILGAPFALRCGQVSGIGRVCGIERTLATFGGITAHALNAHLQRKIPASDLIGRPRIMRCRFNYPSGKGEANCRRLLPQVSSIPALLETQELDSRCRIPGWMLRS